MIRLLTFIVAILLLGFGFAWLADRPGDLLITWQGRQIEMSLMVAVVALVSLVAAIMIAWWLVRTVVTSPHTVRRYFRARKRDRGYQALSTGLIAAGAGDAATARKMTKRTRGLISADQEPLIHLLEAQTAMIEGRYDEARAKFETMVEDPETRALGLHGLYLEARRLGAFEAARNYAERAAEAAPQLPWAAEAALEYRCRDGDWDEALALLERQRLAKTLSREEAERKKAVLLTARAIDRLEGNPAGARDDALEANRLAPDLVPAAVTAARALFREGNLRKGAKILEKNWRLAPHPEVAAAYVRARIGDSATDRLKRAQKLEALKANNVESLLVVAQAALDARNFGLAREKAEAAARLGPRESVFLLLADIEEAETGDQGRVRHWLGLAVRAPRDPAWTADGYVAERWAAVSPVTGRLDAFTWRVPVEQLGGPVLEDGAREGTDGQAAEAFRPLPTPDERRATVIEPDAVGASRPGGAASERSAQGTDARAYPDATARTSESPVPGASSGGSPVSAATEPPARADAGRATRLAAAAADGASAGGPEHETEPVYRDGIRILATPPGQAPVPPVRTRPAASAASETRSSAMAGASASGGDDVSQGGAAADLPAVPPGKEIVSAARETAPAATNGSDAGEERSKSGRAAASDAASRGKADRSDAFPNRPPDDPGVDESGDAAGSPRRFRLF